MKPLVDIVEAAYRLDDNESVWLRGLAEASRTILDTGLGVLFYSYRAAEAMVHLESTGTLGCPEETFGAFFAPGLAARSELQALAQAHRTRPMQTLSVILQPLPEIARMYDDRLRQLGFADVIVANATDPSGRGCAILAPLSSKTQLPPRKFHQWSQVAAHIAAGRRIRQALRGLHTAGEVPAPEAVLRSNGRSRTAGAPLQARALDAPCGRPRSLSTALEAGFESPTPKRHSPPGTR